MGAPRQTMAVVIKTADYKDSDRMLTLLTREYGRMSAAARGARKPTSKLFSAASLFCCGEYMFYEKDGRYGLKSCAVRRTFFNLQNDFDAYAAACFIADAADKVAQEDDVTPGLFALTVSGLYALDTGVPPGTTLSYFVQRLLYIEGVYPSLKSCVMCGSRTGLTRLSAEHGGAVCTVCARAHGGFALEGSIVDALFRMARTSPSAIGSLMFSDEMQNKLKKMLIGYLEYVLQKPLKTTSYLWNSNGKEC